MAKQNPALALVGEIASKLEELKTLIGGGESAPAEETAGVEIPSAKELKKLDKKEVIKLGKELSIETTDVAEIRALLILASRFVAQDDTLDGDDIATLTAGLNLEVSKKEATNRASVSAYLSVGEEVAPDATEETTEDEDDKTESSDDDEDETPKSKKKAKADDDEDEEKPESVDDDEDEEKPAKKGKKAAKADDDDDDDEATVAVEDDDEDETPKAEEDETPETEGPSDDDLKEAITEYNKHTKKPLKSKDIEAMREKLTDDAEVVHPVGEGYTKDGGAWASGYPLLDIEGKDYAKDRVTGKYFKYDDDDNLIEHVKAKK